MENLDMKCAELGQAIAADSHIDEKLLTDVLGVLDEQGLYAAFLYAKARDGNGSKAICKQVSKFLGSTPKGSPLASSGKKDLLGAIKDISNDLDNLLLARDLVRQALVYARYHAKAK